MKPRLQDRHAKGRMGCGFGINRSMGLLGTGPELAKPSCKRSTVSQEQPGLSAEEGVSGRNHHHKPEERETVAYELLYDSSLTLPAASAKCWTAQDLGTLVESLSGSLNQKRGPRQVKWFLTQTCQVIFPPSERRLPLRLKLTNPEHTQTQERMQGMMGQCAEFSRTDHELAMCSAPVVSWHSSRAHWVASLLPHSNARHQSSTCLRALVTSTSGLATCTSFSQQPLEASTARYPREMDAVRKTAEFPAPPTPGLNFTLPNL